LEIALTNPDPIKIGRFLASEINREKQARLMREKA